VGVEIETDFINLEEIISYASSDYEKEFIKTEYGFGLQYYINRIDCLMLNGSKVLDGGAGIGQWSIALSQRFGHVEALDLKSDRLEILKQVSYLMGIENISIKRGSLEDLPYDNDSFDTIFCYGVIMFTDVKKTLSEFYRVLQPGGRLYACLNGDGWNHYLIEERGKQDKNVRTAGQNTLYNTFWRRTNHLEQIQKGYRLMQEVLERLRLKWVFNKLVQLDKKLGGFFRIKEIIAKMLLCMSYETKSFLDMVQSKWDVEFTRRLLDDTWALANGARSGVQKINSESFRPDEFEILIKEAGFGDFQWDVEGGIKCNWLVPADSKYIGYFKDDLAVWECLFTKPEPVGETVSIDYHYKLAQKARDNQVYAEWTKSPIISNASRWSFPQMLLKDATLNARKLGGKAYLNKLAHHIIDKAINEDEAVRKILLFVQKAIFRDPVSQPLTDNGELPDSLTILLCARGRCGHTSKVVIELCRQIGIEGRIKQFQNHIIAEIKVNNRWVIADADAFKNGVIPHNKEGKLLTIEELHANPYQLDCFPATGWFIRPNSRFTKGRFGNRVKGYVDALEPNERGYVSGYYVPEAKGYPPSLPSTIRFEEKKGAFILEWTPSVVKDDRLLGYQVRVGTTSRGWSYDCSGDGDEILQFTSSDILYVETTQTRVEVPNSSGSEKLFASVTAFSDRIEKEPETYFWPSEEISLEINS
jgi:ubiquinone/menaquinone biosynthesis C-methylase UbiE